MVDAELRDSATPQNAVSSDAVAIPPPDKYLHRIPRPGAHKYNPLNQLYAFLFFLHITLLLLTFGLAGCGCADAESSDASPLNAITITPDGNQMGFARTSFTVTAGEEITLTFDNTATSPAMEHNVVILTDDNGDTIHRVGHAALKAASSDYVPEDDAVLAATTVAAPGETVTVTFTAPSEPGKYSYVCTFPGHYAMMQGTMTVE